MLKVGDYVRTKWGTIVRIDKCLGKDIGYKNMEHYEIDRLIGLYNDFILYESDIKKSDPDIIDLLEVGDVLSFKDGSICRIMEISDNGYYLLKDYGGEQYYERKEYIDTLISIVTKEQFESIQYKVGEKQC